jgi:hypothetical protein
MDKPTKDPPKSQIPNADRKLMGYLATVLRDPHRAVIDAHQSGTEVPEGFFTNQLDDYFQPKVLSDDEVLFWIFGVND